MQIKIRKEYENHEPMVLQKTGATRSKVVQKPLKDWNQKALKSWVEVLLRNPKNIPMLSHYFENSIEQLKEITKNSNKITKPEL